MLCDYNCAIISCTATPGEKKHTALFHQSIKLKGILSILKFRPSKRTVSTSANTDIKYDIPTEIDYSIYIICLNLNLLCNVPSGSITSVTQQINLSLYILSILYLRLQLPSCVLLFHFCHIMESIACIIYHLFKKCPIVLT